jgi:hypothetical protein
MSSVLCRMSHTPTLGNHSRDPCGYPRALWLALSCSPQGFGWTLFGGGGVVAGTGARGHHPSKRLDASTFAAARLPGVSHLRAPNPDAALQTQHHHNPSSKGSDIGLCCGLGPIPQKSTMEPSTDREDVVHPEVRAHINSLVSAASDDMPNCPSRVR